MTAGRWAALVLVGVAVSLADLLGHPHGETWWHHVPGFDLVYGVLGCLAIVLGSKALGKLGLQRPERFYEERENREDREL
jgi:hypothetical protein